MDVLTSSIKHIIEEANLPIFTTYDTKVDTSVKLKVTVSNLVPTGLDRFELLDYDSSDVIDANINNMVLVDNVLKKDYIIVAYNQETKMVALDRGLERDFKKGDVWEVVLGDTMTIVGLSNNYVNSDVHEFGMKSRKKRYEFVLTSKNDSTGQKIDKLTRDIGILFSNDFYGVYDEQGVRVKNTFEIVDQLDFIDVPSSDKDTKVSIGRIRLRIYETYRKSI